MKRSFNFRPMVSIVMPVFNGTPTIQAAIRSIQNQTFDAWELVLIDDASNDDLHSLISQFDDSRIRLVKNAVNLGLAASLNRGIGLAVAPYIARMDADDVSYPERLATQYEFLEKHRDVDLVGSKALVFRGNGEAVGIMPAAAKHKEIFDARLSGAFPLYHPTWMGRAEWFRQHAYDPKFHKAQDYELLLRASQTSIYANVQDVLLGYRAEQSNLQKRLLTRCFVLKALAKNALGNGKFRDFLQGSLITCIKGASDVAFSIGRNFRLAEKFRYVQLNSQMVARWTDLWRMVTN
jgi:glycosyltransferase involved in cell wall biosynthesis